MTIVGCDLHTRKQQVAVLHTDTGEVVEQELLHAGDAVEQFYRTLPRPVTIGIESTGYALWFHELMQHLGHTLLVGEAAKIRAMVVRKTKTDRRDAQHLLDLLKHDRFPAVWIPDPATRDLRALVTHRMRLVRMRTMVKNGLHAIAMNPRRLGRLTKQGSPLLRFALGQAGLLAAHGEVDLPRHYRTLLRRRGRPKAIVAIARKLLVRLYIMLRDQIDYEEFRRRGRTPRRQEVPPPALA